MPKGTKNNARAGRFREAVQLCQQSGDGVPDYIALGSLDNGQRGGSVAACQLRRVRCRTDVSVAGD